MGWWHQGGLLQRHPRPFPQLFIGGVLAGWAAATQGTSLTEISQQAAY